MRAIDADELIKEANAEGAYGYVDVAQIERAPTLTRENFIPKAEWEFVRVDDNDMTIYRCTNCKIKRYGRSPFCSQCGAEMKGVIK